MMKQKRRITRHILTLSQRLLQCKALPWISPQITDLLAAVDMYKMAYMAEMLKSQKGNRPLKQLTVALKASNSGVLFKAYRKTGIAWLGLKR